MEFCRDIWKKHIPMEKLAAYKQLIDEGQIRKHHVIYSRSAGSTTVEYYAAESHKTILEELKRRASNETGCGLSASALVD